MDHDTILGGEVVQCEEPNWEPLLNLAPECIDDFMWMFEVETEDGRRLHAYKHYWTRAYIHLDRRGAAFAYTRDGRYAQVGAFFWLHDKVLQPWRGAAGRWATPYCMSYLFEDEDD